MNTPILRATKGKEVKLFYNDGQYNSWKQDENEQKVLQLNIIKVWVRVQAKNLKNISRIKNL